MSLAGVVLWATCFAAPVDPPFAPEAAPLTEEELALLAALTSSVAVPSEERGERDLDSAFSDHLPPTLARNVAQALDSLPTLFRTFRGRDRFILTRDGIRLPATHGSERLQDGWLGLAPTVVGEARWRTAQPPGALGAQLDLDGPVPSIDGWAGTVSAVTRSADRSLTAHALVGGGAPRRGIIVGGHFQTLPTLRLQSDDGAEDGDRLGEQWSAYLRAFEFDRRLSLGFDWNRRQSSRIGGPNPQRQERIDHGLAYLRWSDTHLEVQLGYLRDEFVDDRPRATHRFQGRAESRIEVSERWRLSFGIFGQIDEQTFASDDGRMRRAEPWVGASYSHRRLNVRLRARLLWGSVSSSSGARVESLRPTFVFEADGPVAGGLGWRLAARRGAFVPQSWHLPAIDADLPEETSWTAEVGPTWTGRFGALRLLGFFQRVDDLWPRAALVSTDRNALRNEVLGVEAQLQLRPTSNLDISVAAGWAEELRGGDSTLDAELPATANLRGLVSIRYDFGSDRGFIEAHARWMTDPLRVWSSASSGSDPGAPIRLGIMGGARLDYGLSVALSVENVIDEPFDDPAIDRDQVGLDARIALIYAAF